MKQTQTPLFRLKSINCGSYGGGSLTAAARHNKRTITDSGDAIDPALSHLNRSLFDLPRTPDGVVELAHRLMSDRGFEARRLDATIAAEGLFSLAAVDAPAFDLVAYFSECAKWFESNLGGQLLSADIHLDEANPHCHVLVLLPLTNDGPSGSDLIGYKQKTGERLRDFHEKFALRHGLRMPPPALSTSQKRLLARQVHDRLREENDCVLVSQMWPIVSSLIAQYSERFASQLGITLQAPTVEQLADSSGKGAKSRSAEFAEDRRLDVAWQERRARSSGAGDERPTPMGVAAFCGTPSQQSNEALGQVPDQHPSCVGVASFSSSQLVCESPPLEFAREREGDQRAEDWDGDAGEFRRSAAPAGHPNKAAADAWVQATLATAKAARKPAAVLA